MKYLILIIIVLFSCIITVSAQTNLKDTVYINPKYKVHSVKDDSSHYFFTQYIKLKNKGVKDSLNKYYFKLIKK